MANGLCIRVFQHFISVYIINGEKINVHQNFTHFIDYEQ